MALERIPGVAASSPRTRPPGWPSWMGWGEAGKSVMPVAFWFFSIGGGVLLVVLFALWERNVASRGKDPLVPPRLFAHAQFAAGTILALVFFAAFTSIFFTISLLWQAGLGHTALESGLVSVPFAIGNIIGAPAIHAQASDERGEARFSPFAFPGSP